MAEREYWPPEAGTAAAFPELRDNGSAPGPDSLAAAEFAKLTRSLLDAGNTAEVLDEIVRTAHAVVPGADLVSVTLRSSDGRFHTPVETAPVAVELDQAQYRTGEGPCVDASRMPGPGHIRSKDLAHEPAWPSFGPIAARRGYIGVLSTALLRRSARPSGALNIYSRRPDALDARAKDIALLLATHASLALSGSEAMTLAELEAAHLRTAIESRDVIGQAKGILMQRRGISADEAFDLLRQTSQRLNVKIAELARTLAGRHQELEPASRANRRIPGPGLPATRPGKQNP
jgi:hypothetical protein